MADAPRVSVVVASFRWPEALRLSLRSALAQSVSDIEILVVEDGLDRASRGVSNEFADPRVRWLSLWRNSGSQARPNQRGRREARAPVIAYLGHDDLWHPDHLRHLLHALTPEVDIAHATTLMLGHPYAGVLVAGAQAWRRGTFVPPSSIAHRRESDRVGRWRRAGGGDLPVDYDFLRRAAAAGARFASTGQPTVFKFSSWGFAGNGTRDVAAQRRLADRLAQDPRLGQRMVADALASGAADGLPFDERAAGTEHHRARPQP